MYTRNGYFVITSLITSMRQNYFIIWDNFQTFLLVSQQSNIMKNEWIKLDIMDKIRLDIMKVNIFLSRFQLVIQNHKK